MRNPTDVTKISPPKNIALQGRVRVPNPPSCQLEESFAGPYPQLKEPDAVALTSIELCYIKTEVNIHTVFFH